MWTLRKTNCPSPCIWSTHVQTGWMSYFKTLFIQNCAWVCWGWWESNSYYITVITYNKLMIIMDKSAKYNHNFPELCSNCLFFPKPRDKTKNSTSHLTRRDQGEDELGWYEGKSFFCCFFNWGTAKTLQQKVAVMYQRDGWWPPLN